MVRFDYGILANLILIGFRALRFENREDYGIITPIPDCSDLVSSNSYTIPIGDLQSLEMAGGVDEFDFYIDHQNIIKDVLS